MYIYVYYYYICILSIKNFVHFVFCNIVATHAHIGYTGFTFTKSFSAAFP